MNYMVEIDIPAWKLLHQRKFVFNNILNLPICTQILQAIMRFTHFCHTTEKSMPQLQPQTVNI